VAEYTLMKNEEARACSSPLLLEASGPDPIV
jgi:hypothetical protein